MMAINFGIAGNAKIPKKLVIEAHTKSAVEFYFHNRQIALQRPLFPFHGGARPKDLFQFFARIIPEQ